MVQEGTATPVDGYQQLADIYIRDDLMMYMDTGDKTLYIKF